MNAQYFPIWHWSKKKKHQDFEDLGVWKKYTYVHTYIQTYIRTCTLYVCTFVRISLACSCHLKKKSHGVRKESVVFDVQGMCGTESPPRAVERIWWKNGAFLNMTHEKNTHTHTRRDIFFHITCGCHGRPLSIQRLLLWTYNVPHRSTKLPITIRGITET